jgi:predicted nucleotidyltransferase
MDKGEAINIAKTFLELISTKYDIKQTLLFGSFAKGTSNEDSDIDIAIVMNETTSIIDIQIELMKLRRKVDLRIEPHPFKQVDFIRNNPMVDEILKYGIAI